MDEVQQIATRYENPIFVLLDFTPSMKSKNI